MTKDYGDTTTTAWSSQPYFVLADDSYNRMMHKLAQGSKGEWSYPCGACPCPSRCTCAKMLNVLRNGEIARLVRGEWRPVHKASDFVART